jgi:hypothetical protein
VLERHLACNREAALLTATFGAFKKRNEHASLTGAFDRGQADTEREPRPVPPNSDEVQPYSTRLGLPDGALNGTAAVQKKGIHWLSGQFPAVVTKLPFGSPIHVNDCPLGRHDQNAARGGLDRKLERIYRIHELPAITSVLKKARLRQSPRRATRSARTSSCTSRTRLDRSQTLEKSLRT